MKRPVCRPGPARWAGLLVLLLGSSLTSATVRAAEPFELKNGDRVVFLGGTFIEREQSYGYVETALTARFADRDITFRNLGWSGDTSYGDARAGFGGRADGFQHLKEHVLALKPTLLLVGYGMSESFDGDSGLPSFEQGLNALLDALAPTRAKVVLLTPIAHEDLGRPLPDPAEHNRSLKRYGEAVADESKVCRSPFAGTVSRVEVEPGRKIAPNETLIVLEAMKMETIITAPVAGVIARVNVAVGDAVQQGKVLIVFE